MKWPAVTLTRSIYLCKSIQLTAPDDALRRRVIALQEGPVHWAMTKERLIKKYANRRLYDASISKHVTLEDIRDLIVRGEKIRVVEDKTGEDITRLILLQVIAEQEQFGKPILTTQLLESIIRYYGGPMQEFMAGYLEQSVAAFMRQQENVQQQISSMLTSAPPPVNAMAELTRQNMEMWNRMQEGMLAMLVPARKPRDSAEPGESDATDETTAALKGNGP